MAIVIRYMYCLVFISRSSDLIQYGGIVTKANRLCPRCLDKFPELCAGNSLGCPHRFLLCLRTPAAALSEIWVRGTCAVLLPAQWCRRLSLTQRIYSSYLNQQTAATSRPAIPATEQPTTTATSTREHAHNHANATRTVPYLHPHNTTHCEFNRDTSSTMVARAISIARQHSIIASRAR